MINVSTIKPKMLKRLQNSVLLSWEGVFNSKEGSILYRLEMLDDFYEWKNVYW